jgi:hypothetical protein
MGFLPGSNEWVRDYKPGQELEEAAYKLSLRDIPDILASSLTVAEQYDRIRAIREKKGMDLYYAKQNMHLGSEKEVVVPSKKVSFDKAPWKD